MPDYNYGDYAYLNNMNDTPNEHHNHFILNQIIYLHIKSPFKLCDDIFGLFPNLFFDKMI